MMVDQHYLYTSERSFHARLFLLNFVEFGPVVFEKLKIANDSR